MKRTSPVYKIKNKEVVRDLSIADRKKFITPSPKPSIPQSLNPLTLTTPVMKQLLSHLLIALLSSAISFVLFQEFYPSAPPAETVLPPRPVQFIKNEAPLNTGPQSISAMPSDFIAASREVTNTVVNIAAYSDGGYGRSNGSGVIFSRDGFIITNYHVVEGGGQVEVTLPDKRRLQARIIGSDPTTDLSLIKVNARDLEAITFGDSDQVEVGEWVLAVGNPFNLTSTVTAGIVSAKARNLNIIRGDYSVESFIQTDAVVNPGNSGGALVNTQGELIGINTAIISESGGYEGYSFAIPVNLVRKVVADLRDFGTVQRAILGVRIRELDNETSAELRLPAPEGVLVAGIKSGGSADRAGIQAGDVIISINDIRTASVPELQEQIARYRPGDRIRLEVYRRGRLFSFDDVKLQGLSQLDYSNR